MDLEKEKEKISGETPCDLVSNVRDTDNDTKESELKTNEEEKKDEEQKVSGDSPKTNELQPTESSSEDMPDEDDGQPAKDNDEEIRGEKTSGGGEDGEETTMVKSEEGEAEESVVEPEPELPPDLSKVSEEVDQYLIDIDTLLKSKGEENEDESSSPKPALDEVPKFVEQFASLVDAKLEGYNSGETIVKWSQLEEEDATSLLESVNRISRLSKSLSKLSSKQNFAKSISHVGGVLHRAMSYLEEEFRSYLEDFKINDPSTVEPTEETPKAKTPKANAPEEDQTGESDDKQTTTPAPPEEDNFFPGYTEETVSNLNKFAKAMTLVRYETECWQVYYVARRNALEESLRRLGFEKHSIDDVQKMNWESVEREIGAWIATFKHYANAIFSCEKKLTEAVFNDCVTGLSTENIFTDICHGLVIQFLIFPEAVAMTKRSAEKLFKFLDLYEAMRDLFPTMYTHFLVQYVNEIKSEVALTRGRLGEGMVSIFIELENAIMSDSGKTPVPGGAVHPLTRYTMNYLNLVEDYKDTLEQVFREHQKIDRADSTTGSDFNYNSQPAQSYKPPVAPKQSPFELQITKVMELLDGNLESKSKLYKDPSLCSIFMMNNGRYILQKVKKSPRINSLLGDHWFRKRSSDLRQYHKNYQRETWGRLLQCLSIEGLNNHGKVNKPMLKERFKSFNAVFDEIHKTQSTWVISDEQLQSELRVSISNMVIPAYRSFLARYSQTFTPGRQTEKYVKYQPEDIETYIDELFDGNAKK